MLNKVRGKIFCILCSLYSYCFYFYGSAPTHKSIHCTQIKRSFRAPPTKKIESALKIMNRGTEPGFNIIPLLYFWCFSSKKILAYIYFFNISSVGHWILTPPPSKRRLKNPNNSLFEPLLRGWCITGNTWT